MNNDGSSRATQFQEHIDEDINLHLPQKKTSVPNDKKFYFHNFKCNKNQTCKKDMQQKSQKSKSDGTSLKDSGKTIGNENFINQRYSNNGSSYC